MKRFLMIAVTLALVAAFSVAGIVMAQDDTPTPETPGWGGMMMGAGQGPVHEYMEAAMAKALGLTVEELQDRHANGETFWDIAEEKGYSQEEAQQMMLDARSAALDEAVKAGAITQEQADWMKERGTRMHGRGQGAGGCMGGGFQSRGHMGGRWGR